MTLQHLILVDERIPVGEGPVAGVVVQELIPLLPWPELLPLPHHAVDHPLPLVLFRHHAATISDHGSPRASVITTFFSSGNQTRNY